MNRENISYKIIDLLNCLRLCFECVLESVTIVFHVVEEVRQDVVQKDAPSPLDHVLVHVLWNLEKSQI